MERIHLIADKLLNEYCRVKTLKRQYVYNARSTSPLTDVNGFPVSYTKEIGELGTRIAKLETAMAEMDTIFIAVAQVQLEYKMKSYSPDPDVETETFMNYSEIEDIGLERIAIPKSVMELAESISSSYITLGFRRGQPVILGQ